MNQTSAAELYKSLASFKNTGIAEWKECIFTRNFGHDEDISCRGSKVITAAKENLKRLLNGSVVGDIKTFVKQKVYRRMSSIADDCSGQPYFGQFGGRPLQLEDNFGDISISEFSKVPIFAVIDQNALVPETLLQEMVSHLRCAFTSESSVSDPHLIFQNLFPMIVFCKWSKQSHDVGGIELITALDGNSGKFHGFIERRLSLNGKYPSTIWCTDSTPNSSPNHPSSQKLNSGKFHARCLQNLTRQHLTGSRPNAKPVVSMQSYAEYDVLESNRPLSENSDQEVSLTNVTVSITCSKVSKILHVDEQHIIDAKLKVMPVPGDMRSSAISFYKAIQILEGFFSAFGESGEIKWLSVDDSASADKTNKKNLTMTEQIQEIIASYNQEWMLWNKERTKVTSKEKQDHNETSGEQTPVSRQQQQMIFPREELDFTERIWEILQCAKSCQELTGSFKLILKEIGDGKATQFWLHRNNNTTLARLIKESYVGDVTSKIQLSSANCIMLLIEIGLDKLARDYNNFFISNRLASSSRLAEYFDVGTNQHEPGEKLVQVLERRFIMLKKLHHIVELIVQCKYFLGLSDEQIFLIAKTALHDYISEELDFKKTFIFPIEYSEVESVLKDRLPMIWKLTLSTKENSTEKTASHCWMTEYPFKGIISQPLNDDEKIPSDRTTSTSSAFENMVLEYYIVTQTTSMYTF